MKCDTCKIQTEASLSEAPACCIWFMDNVICGEKSIDECDCYKPIEKDKTT